MAIPLRSLALTFKRSVLPLLACDSISQARAGLRTLQAIARPLRCRGPGRNDTPPSAKASVTGKAVHRVAAALLLGACAAGAQATLITFDDLPPPYPPDEFASTPVTTEYASLGLIVNEGYLVGSGVPGSDQALLGAPTMSLSFTGTLPTWVSLYVSAPNQDQVYVDATGPGWGASVTTDGWGPPGTQTPYRPNQHVSFHSVSGISDLRLSAFYFLRVGMVIDNLYFGNVAPVPEPASLALLGAGVLTLAAVRRTRRQRPQPV